MLNCETVIASPLKTSNTGYNVSLFSVQIGIICKEKKGPDIKKYINIIHHSNLSLLSISLEIIFQQQNRIKLTDSYQC